MEEDYSPLALEAVLLFHSGSPWNADKQSRWINICERVKAPKSKTDYGLELNVGWDATAKTLCDIARAAIEQRESGYKE